MDEDIRDSDSGVRQMSGGLLGVGAFTSIGLGAILLFAVDWQWESADRSLVGLIMIAVGALALTTYVAVSGGRRDSTDRRG